MLSDALGPLPSLSLLEQYECQRQNGDSAFEWMEKALLHEAMMRKGLKQVEAAKALGISPRVLNYQLAKYRVRPVDQEGK